MNKDIKQNMTPKLRFSEFKNDGEWKEKELNKLGKLISGLTYKPSDVCEMGLLVLRSSNIKDNEIVFDDCVYVTNNIKGAHRSKYNDILICIRNGSKKLIGKNALIPNDIPICTHGTFMSIFRAESPKFIYQLFQTELYKKQVAADLGATINSINGNQFKRYKFPIPSPKEQQKIADCLTSIDDYITAQTKKLDALETHKKGLIQKLFPSEGKTVPELRFPKFKNDNEWKKKQIR